MFALQTVPCMNAFFFFVLHRVHLRTFFPLWFVFVLLILVIVAIAQPLHCIACKRVT
jgi:hypothetical protein